MRIRALTIVAVSAFSIASAQSPKGAGPDPALVNELVLANHILANEGVVDAYGHVSVRDTRNPNHFRLAGHMAAGVVTASDIIEYDLDSKPVDPNARAGYTERFIHGEIYRARPDVMAVVHCHSPELIPFGATGVPLRPIAHLAGFLGEGVPVFEIRDVAGMTDLLIRDNKLGRALAQTLGQKPAALMRGHGAVVVGPNLHVVAGRSYYMNLDARLQWQATLLGGGKINFLTPEEAGKASAQDGYERAWDYWKHKLGVK